MAENRFDALLRDALLDANWTEVRTGWEEAEEPDFSPPYLRWRRNLLADPFGFVKRKLRPVWARALRMAACIVLISAVALGTLMAVSSTVRAAVLNWLREISGNYMTYTSGQTAQTDALPSNWRLTWLPEGWELTETTGGATRSSYSFSGPEGRVRFVCAYPDKGSIGSSVRDAETIQNCRQVTVQGYPADLYVEEGEWTYLVWEGPDGILFWFSGTGISVEELTEIAEGAQPIAEQLPDYQLSWVPDGYTRFEHIAAGSAVQQTWIGPDDTSLTLLYAAEPVELPESTPETVQVRGVDAQFWAAAEPHTSNGSITVNGEEVEGNQTEVGDIAISVGTIAGPSAADVSTLAWQDPDTGLYFRIHGTVDQDILLRIAEYVKLAE